MAKKKSPLKTAEVVEAAVEAEEEPEVVLTELREPETTDKVATRVESLTSPTSLLCDEGCCSSALL